MFHRRPVLLIGLLLVSLPLGGCEILRKGNVFVKPDQAAIAASKAGRIPVVAADQILAPSVALAGKAFNLPDAAPLAAWPVAGGTSAQSMEHVQAAPAFRQLWSRAFGLASKGGYHVTAPPVAANGRIFVMDAAAGVRAMDAATGRQVWRADLRPRSRADRKGYGGGLAYDDGKLYVASGFRFVAALDAATGRQLWRTATPGPIHSAPNVGTGRVFAIDNDNRLMAFDAASGQLQWDYLGLSDSARILASSSPAVVEDTVIAAFSSGELVRLRASSGAEIWEPQSVAKPSRTSALNEIRDIAGRPVVYKGDIFASSHSGVTSAINLASGQIRWSLPIGSISSPWAAGDVIYVTSQAGEVVCISRANGDVYWITDLNRGLKTKDRAQWTGPVLASGRLIVASNKGRAIALDAKTGAVQKRIKIGGDAVIAPIAVNGMVYIVTEQAKLIAID